MRRKIIEPIVLAHDKVPDEESDAINLNSDQIAAIYHTADQQKPPIIVNAILREEHPQLI